MKIREIFKKYLKNPIIGSIIGAVPFAILKFITNRLGGPIIFLFIFSYFGVPTYAQVFLKYGLLIFGVLGLIIGFIYNIMPKKRKKIFLVVIASLVILYFLLILISIIISLLLGPKPMNIFE